MTTMGRCILRSKHRPRGKFLRRRRHRRPDRRPGALRRRIQVISFEDPYSSLNPRQVLGTILAELMKVRRPASMRRVRTTGARAIVGVRDSTRISLIATRTRCRVASASGRHRARSRSIPNSSSAMRRYRRSTKSIQAQILNLLEDLREKFNLTYLFIAHDLSVARHLWQRVAVMYLDMSSNSPIATRCSTTCHPYTRDAPLAAVPVPDPTVEADRRFLLLSGEVPSPINPPRAASSPALDRGRRLPGYAARSCASCGRAIGLPAAKSPEK